MCVSPKIAAYAIYNSSHFKGHMKILSEKYKQLSYISSPAQSQSSVYLGGFPGSKKLSDTVYPKVYKRDPFSGIVREFQMNRIGSLALMYILDACPILVALNALIIN